MPRSERKRLQRLQRLIRAMGYLRMLHEREVQQAVSRQRALEEKRAALFAAFGCNEMHGDRLAELLRHNLDETARAAHEARIARERSEQALRRQQARQRHIQRQAGKSGQALRKREAQDALLDAIEQALHRRR